MKQCMLIVFDPYHVRRSLGHCSKGGDVPTLQQGRSCMY